jgi:hypothetical protein
MIEIIGWTTTMLSMTSPMIVKRPTIIRDIITRVLTSTLLGYKMQKKKMRCLLEGFDIIMLANGKVLKSFHVDKTHDLIVKSSIQ